MLLSAVRHKATTSWWLQIYSNKGFLQASCWATYCSASTSSASLDHGNKCCNTVSPGDSGSIQSVWLSQISTWMCQNFLQLNKDKSEPKMSIYRFLSSFGQKCYKQWTDPEIFSTIRKLMAEYDLEKPFHAFIFSSLDYFNGDLQVYH